MIDNRFIQLKDDEASDINGGSAIITTIAVVGSLATIYGIVRETVRDKGRADAYEDLAQAR